MTGEENDPIDDAEEAVADEESGLEPGDPVDDIDESDDIDADESESDDVGETGRTFGGRYTDGAERPMWQLVAGVVAVIAMVAAGTFLAFSVFDSSDDGAGGGGGGGAPAQTATSDDFARADVTDGMGSTDNGLPWTPASGTWGIREGEAVLTTPNDTGPRSVTTITTAGSDGTLTVQAGQLVQGWGVVFRFQGQFNYWYLVAQPDFATYSLGRIVDGVDDPLGGVGLANISDGVEIEISLDGPAIEIMVDGKLTRALTDTTLAGATGVGLLAQGASATEASWRSIRADMVPSETPQFSETTPTTAPGGGGSVPGTTGPTTSAG